MKLKNPILSRATAAVFLIFLASSAPADEGMYPISEIHKLNLNEKGLKIDAGKIYNPSGVSLIDGIVKLGGGTGSFVSDRGLMITNHHVAYRAAQAASTEKEDYIKNGFLAPTPADEVLARGYTVRITESYRDVSNQVLSVVKEDMKLADRTRATEKKIKALVKEVEDAHPGKRCEVAEMFPGKTYVLFIYTYLKDVRMVYVPPNALGNFGGETDNWVWPRHAGDFAFMRAYTAPDGSPAEYSPDNVPYRPRKVLKVAPRGVNEEDFVFILGYPARTFRHRTSHYLAFEKEVRLPWVADCYAWQNSIMEKMGRGDRGVAIKHLSRIKGRSNTMKNYRGKLKGFRRLPLLEHKRKEERALQKFIDADPTRKKKYGTVLAEIGKVYDEILENAGRELVLDFMRRRSADLLYIADSVYQASKERRKPDLERDSAFMDRNFDRTKRRLLLTIRNYYEMTDRILLKDMLLRASRLPEGQRIAALEDVVGQDDPEVPIEKFIDSLYGATRLNDTAFLTACFEKTPLELVKTDDAYIRFARKLYPEFEALKEARKWRKGALDGLSARLIDVKKQFLKTDFVPDANLTLRFTFGRIRGYSPSDGVYCEPLTTVKGILEKHTGRAPFNIPEKIIRLHEKKDFGRFASRELKDVPVGILYNMDTTGGSSGSPVFNARGEIVGINFDRAYEATINDYAWNESYSRSIAVDIRYVLWVTEKFAGAGHLLEEMGVK